MSDIREQIEILVKIQNLDDQIFTLKTDLNNMDEQIDTIDKKVAAFDLELNHTSQGLEDLQKEYRSLEADIKMNTSMIEKSQEKSRSVKTNKEYQSILKEIDEMDKKNSAIEDTMIEHLEKVEAYEAVIEQKKSEQIALTARAEREKKDITKQRETKIKSLEALYEDVDKTGCLASPDIIKMLQVVKTKVRGSAIAAVEGAICQGCHLNIPPQLYNELQRFENIKLCPNCQRIIYWKKSEKG